MSAAIAQPPDFLTRWGRWLLWKYVKRDKLVTKEPRTMQGALASVTRPLDWAPFEAVSAALVRAPGAWDGLGFVFGDRGDGHFGAGVDVDSCLDGDGRLLPWAMPYVELLRPFCYIEISPSGRGLKAFPILTADDAHWARPLFATTPDGWGCTRRIDVPGFVRDTDHDPGVEIYLSGRYFTVTARHWPGSLRESVVLPRRELEQLAALLPKAAGPTRPIGGGGTPLPENADLTVDPEALQAKLDAALKDSPKLRARWNGDPAGPKDNSGSAFDFSLGAILKALGFSFAEMRAAVMRCPHGTGKKHADDARHWERIWQRTSTSQEPPPVTGEADYGGNGQQPESEGDGRLRPADVNEAEVEPEPEAEPELDEAEADPAAATLGPAPPPVGPGHNQPDPLNALVRQFNEVKRYAVANEGGKACILWPVFDYGLKRERLDRVSVTDFETLYRNQKLTIRVGNKNVTKNLAQWWLDHPRRRQYLGGVVFAPGMNVPDDALNLWKGWGVQPAPGDWSLMRDHLKTIICGGRENIFDYAERWMARMFQYPGEAGEVAIVIKGEEGVGKGILGRWLAEICGEHGMPVGQAEHLVGRFTGHLRNLVFLFADEALFAGNKQHENILKGLITEKTITREAKYQQATEMPNFLHLMMASNATWVIPAGHQARRYLVLAALDSRMGDFAYFTAIERQMKNGGAAAMLYDLLRLDVSNFHPRVVPHTREIDEQKLLSQDTLEQWWSAVLARGFVYRSRYGHPDFLQWDPFVTTGLLTQSYLQWCDDNHARALHRQMLGRMMTASYTGSRPREEHIVYEADSVNSRDPQPVVRMFHQRGYWLGELAAARSAFRAGVGLSPAEPGDEQDAEPDDDA